MFSVFTKRENIKYESKTVSDLNTVPVSSEFSDIQKLDFQEGRFYNESESNSGAALVVLGYDVAKNLFDNEEAIGKKLGYTDKILM